jgi:hypothetical protein
MQCEEFVRLIDAYVDDALDEHRRHGWRDHLRSCAECRERALAAEPTLLLGLASAQEPAPQRVEDCVRSVQAMIRQERLQRRLGPRRPRPWMAAAAAVIMALGLGAVWHLGSGPGLEGGAARVAEDAVGQEPTGRTGTVPDEADPAAPLPAGQAPAPEVRVDMDGEGVRVYHFAAAGGDDDTTVAFIVNPALES